MYNRKAFKQEAKQLIRESKPHYMLVTLVYFLLTTALSTVVSKLGETGGLGAGILSVFLSILVTLFLYVMTMGYTNYALRLSRREETGMKSLFEAFSYSGRSIGLHILIGIYTFAWSMLLAFGVVIVMAVVGLAFGGVDKVTGEVTPLFILAAVVLCLAVMVLIIIISLRYSMARFTLADNPDKGASAAIRRSVQIMKGNKGKFFVMQLSFIGWEIVLGLISLVVLTVGFFVSGATWVFESLATVWQQSGQVEQVMNALGVQLFWWTVLADVVCLPLKLWVIPYSQTAYARFYNHVSGHDQCVAVRDGVQPESIPAAVGAPVADQPESEAPQPPAGGYYTPPAAPQEEVAAQENEEVEEL